MGGILCGYIRSYGHEAGPVCNIIVVNSHHIEIVQYTKHYTDYIVSLNSLKGRKLKHRNIQ